MAGATKEIKLVKVGNGLSDSANYVAHIANRQMLDYDEVVDEVLKRGALNISKPMLKMVVEHTLETMIVNTLKDGNSRRLGDYFTLQMEVSGRFDAPDDQFDPDRHRLSLVLRPLKALKRECGRDDLKVYNRNAGPKVVIDRMYSVSTPDKDTLVYGDDIVLEGENLFFSESIEVEADSLSVGYYSKNTSGPLCNSSTGSLQGTVSEDGRRMVISWKDTIGSSIQANWNIANPEKSPPIGVMVALRSRGGQPTAKRQLHRIRAFFDTWMARHPGYRLDSMSWGRL